MVHELDFIYRLKSAALFRDIYNIVRYIFGEHLREKGLATAFINVLMV